MFFFLGSEAPKSLPGGADTSAGLEDGPVGAVRLRLPGADGLYICGGCWRILDLGGWELRTSPPLQQSFPGDA